MSLLVFCFQSAEGAHFKQINCVLSDGFYDRSTLIEAIPEGTMLNQLTYQTDIPLSYEEFIDLVSFSEGIPITAEQIEQTLFYCSRKNKFKRITFEISYAHEGISIHCIFKSFWTFKSVKIKGILLGREVYKSYYLLSPGDRFDNEKHEHSLEKIKKLCAQEGYLQASVSADIKKDPTTKSISVVVHIDRKHRFTIGHNRLNIIDEHNDADIISLTHHISTKYLKSLSGSVYQSCAIESCKQNILKYLARKGYMEVVIEQQETLDSLKPTLHITWTINLGSKRLFIFWGNQSLTSQQLLDGIMAFGRSLSLLPVTLLAQEISRIYHDKGFLDVVVDCSDEKDKSIFIIQEGKQASIGSVVVEGITAFEEKVVMRCFKQLLHGKYLIKQQVKTALDNIEMLYREHGFFDAAISHYAFIPTENASIYNLHVIITEGNRSMLNSIEIEGLSQDDVNALKHMTYESVAKDACVTEDLIQVMRSIILKYVHQKGYLQAHIQYAINRSDDGSAIITWNVDKGDPIVFGKTIVKGCCPIPYSYIKSLCAYKELDVWDHQKIKQTFLNFKNLDVFDAVSLCHISEPLNESSRIIILNIPEDDPFEVRLRAGLELQRIRQYRTFGGVTYKFGGTLLFKNPFDQADHIRLSADIAHAHREIVMQYARPFLSDIKLKTLLQAYSIRHEQPGFIGSNINVYTVYQNGALLGLSKSIEHLDMGANAGFEWMKTQISEHDDTNPEYAACVARAIDFEPRLLGEHIPYFFIEPTFFADFLDNKVNPSGGFSALASLKGMIACNRRCNATSFVKLLIEQSCFTRWHAIVFAMRIRFGHIFYREFKSIMPSERFYLGGSRSVRGYDTDIMPPLGVFCDLHGNRSLVPRGGRSMININVEMRFPIVKALSGVVFQDMGLLSGNNFRDVKSDTVGLASGFGLRFATPIGPLRFDIGFRWHKQTPDDNRYAWFLTFGQAF